MIDIKVIKSELMNKYNPIDIQKKWLSIWNDESYIKKRKTNNKKFYCLDMFPYPSGSGLHVGHWRGYVLSDIYARIKWLENYEVLHPMGWDAFGLPAENFAIKNKIHPKEAVDKNIKIFKKEIKEIAGIYDWSKEINTTDPEYYKWTQWIFLKMFKEGLAYEDFSDINWCSSCKTGLANEEVLKGSCERCGTVVHKKKVRQWMLKITKYADKLLDGLKNLEWPEKVKLMQENWIGKSEGVEIDFKIEGFEDLKCTTFTSRPETIYGVTAIVIGHDHSILEKIVPIDKKEEVLKVCKTFSEKIKTENEYKRDKRGVFTHSYAINPLTNERIPIYAAPYVLSDYGTGIVMLVAAHDERDYEFAKEHYLSIRHVIQNPNGDNSSLYTGDGILINSGSFDGLLSNKNGKEEIVNFLIQRKVGKKKVNYRMRDWVFSRQRYWGEPIPLIHCKDCGIVPVEEKDLPVVLPNVENYEPTGTGESPLANIDEWVNTKCPSCQKDAKRETNTMPQWAGSCWYFLRYPNPSYKEGICDEENLKKWLPVDLYVGGVEHAILHLLYSRFYVKFLHEIKVLNFDEPFKKLFNQGMITCYSEKTKSIEKMSKSKGNVVSPNELVKKYGTDTLRLYIVFMGPPELDSEWKDTAIEGCHRFLKKVWNTLTSEEYSCKKEDETIDSKKALNKFLKEFMFRIKTMHTNTAVASAMEFFNKVTNKKLKLSKESKESILTILSIIVPFISSELLEIICDKELTAVSWPTYDEDLANDDFINITIQINGKTRKIIEVDPYITDNMVKEKAKNEAIKWLENKEIKKEIYVKGKLINFVIL